MTRHQFSLLTILIALAVAFLAGREFVQATVTQPNDSRLKQLLKERVEIRKKDLEEKRKTGIASLHEVARAQADLLQAELDACETKAQRIGILEMLVEREKQTYEVYVLLQKREHLPDRLLLQIPRIEAEITLEREKLKP